MRPETLGRRRLLTLVGGAVATVPLAGCASPGEGEGGEGGEEGEGGEGGEGGEEGEMSGEEGEGGGENLDGDAAVTNPERSR